MSDPVHIVEPPRARPAVVSAAVWLLYLVAALEVVSVAVQLSQAGTVADVYEDAYRGTESEGLMGTSMVVGTVLVAVVFGLLAIGFVVLGLLNGRGKNAARIVTWVLAGVGLCCGLLGSAGNALTSSFNTGGGNGDQPDPAEVQRRLEAALPSWYQPLTISLGVPVLLALAAVIVLLALPPANEFFRKPAPVWQPPYPTAGGGYVQPGAYYPAPGTPPPPPGAVPPPGTQPPGTQPPQSPPGTQPPSEPPRW